MLTLLLGLPILDIAITCALIKVLVSWVNGIGKDK